MQRPRSGATFMCQGISLIGQSHYLKVSPVPPLILKIGSLRQVLEGSVALPRLIRALLRTMFIPVGRALGNTLDCFVVLNSLHSYAIAW